MDICSQAARNAKGDKSAVHRNDQWEYRHWTLCGTLFHLPWRCSQIVHSFRNENCHGEGTRQITHDPSSYSWSGSFEWHESLRQYGFFAQWNLWLTYWRDLHVADGENLVALRWTNNPYPITVKREPHSLYVSYDAAASLDRRVKNEYNSHMIKCTPEELTKHAAHASEQQARFTNGNPFGPHVIVASEPASEYLRA